MQAAVFAAGAAIAMLLSRLAGRRPRGVGWVWFGGLLPTVWVDLDHLARFSHWPLLSYHRPGFFALEVFLLALSLSTVVALVLVLPSTAYLRWRRSRRAGRVAARLSILLTAGLIVGAVLQLALLPGMGRAGGSSRRIGTAELKEAPNVLLFTIDTLRRDALGVYGGPKTPGFDRWISQGVRCEGWSCSPWTRPSFASLFSAVAPTGHGADRYRPVCKDVAWWPQILQNAGYRTMAWVSNPHLEGSLGFSRGFDAFDHSSRIERLDPVAQMIWVRWLERHLQASLDRGDRIIARARRWLSHRPDGPWLVWVHVLDPHMPYHLRGPRGETVDPHPGNWLEPLRPFLEKDAVWDVRAIRAAADTLSPSAKDALGELYRREVLFLDRQVGRLLDSAQEASGNRPLLWIVASDHGEEFFEHGGFEHGHTLYAELLRIPLAFGGMGLPRGALGTGMKIEDVGPTVLSLLHLPAMRPAGRAVSMVDSLLAPYVFGVDRSEMLRAAQPAGGGMPDAECSPPLLLAEDLLYGTQRTRLILEGGRGVLRDDEEISFARIDACGPGRERPVMVSPAKLSATERGLLDALDRWRAAARRIALPEVDDPALRARLRSLGYVE